MEAVADQEWDDVIALLGLRFRQWRAETSEDVKRRVKEIIDHADQGNLDLMRSRTVEQQVLDLLDEPAAR